MDKKYKHVNMFQDPSLCTTDGLLLNTTILILITKLVALGNTVKHFSTTLISDIPHNQNQNPTNHPAKDNAIRMEILPNVIPVKSYWHLHKLDGLHGSDA